MICLPFESREAFDRFVKLLKEKGDIPFPDSFKEAVPYDIDKRLS